MIDTREQKGWTWEPSQVSVTRRALPAGDYSLAGLEEEIALERKSIGDLVGTVIHDMVRFRKELLKLAGYKVAAICVEGTPGMVLRHEYESEANPLSVMGRLESIWLDHGIPTLWWEDRKTAGELAFRVLRMHWRRAYSL